MAPHTHVCWNNKLLRFPFLMRAFIFYGRHCVCFDSSIKQSSIAPEGSKLLCGGESVFQYSILILHEMQSNSLSHSRNSRKQFAFSIIYSSSFLHILPCTSSDEPAFSTEGPDESSLKILHESQVT